jgi:hypothetical protein
MAGVAVLSADDKFLSSEQCGARPLQPLNENIKETRAVRWALRREGSM